jgi:hypothetical protein
VNSIFLIKKLLKMVAQHDWKVSLLVYGFALTVGGLCFIFYEYNYSPPNKESLLNFEGNVEKIKWERSSKTSHVYVLYVNNDSFKVNLTMGNECASSRNKLSAGDFISLSYEPASIALVDGTVYAISKDGSSICTYSKSVSTLRKAHKDNYNYSIFGVIVGLTLFLIGYRMPPKL